MASQCQRYARWHHCVIVLGGVGCVLGVKSHAVLSIFSVHNQEFASFYEDAVDC